MPHRERVKTGVKGLDHILAAGIPRGNTILLQGPVGAGKTTLGVEFVYRGATVYNEPGMIVLFEASADRVIDDAMELGWDLRALERAGKLRIIFTTRRVFADELQKPDSLLLEEVSEIGARRIFVDGLPGTADEHVSTATQREAFRRLAEALQRVNLSSIVSMEADALRADHTIALPEEAVADTVIRLRREEVARSALRSLEIVKSRGHDFHMGRHSFKIVDGVGIEVYHRVQAPRRVNRDRTGAYDFTTRISTGIPGLDPLVNGGYFLGSTTVVAGISGAGKSVMGLQYLAEGARLQQRGLMLSLDEPVEQVIRNATTIGIPLQQYIDDGIVKVQYDTPQEIEIDRHFSNVEDLMNDFKPTRVVFDSLSTYGSNLGTTGRMFRDFFHALVALMKEHQTATVYNHENPEMLGMASMMGDFAMSSLVDNILLMNWIEMGDAFRLALTVAKMRANPNARVTRECEILDGKGLQVLPRLVPPQMVRPFSSYLNLISRNPSRTQTAAGD
jgi:circadian clock protein KaiC